MNTILALDFVINFALSAIYWFLGRNKENWKTDKSRLISAFFWLAMITALTNLFFQAIVFFAVFIILYIPWNTIYNWFSLSKNTQLMGLVLILILSIISTTLLALKQIWDGLNSILLHEPAKSVEVD
jgi:hypothetical protein